MQRLSMRKVQRPNVLISRSENLGFGPGLGVFLVSLTSFSISVLTIRKTLSKFSLRLCVSITPIHYRSCHHKLNNQVLMHSLFFSEIKYIYHERIEAYKLEK